MNSFKSLQDAYLYGLKSLKDRGCLVNSVTDKQSVGSQFGVKRRDFVELKGFGFILENPRHRIISSNVTKPSFGFSIANLLWVLSGSNKVETISFYNKKGKAFSDNGVYYEAAFGDRLFGDYNLWNYAKEIILNDKTTRRALIPMFIPKDLIELPRDTPCVSSIQLMVRNNRLDFFLNMRSQSAAIVLPYDLFLFTMLQELFSLILGYSLGNFYYYCNSFHFYKEEEQMVNDILEESNLENKINEMPKMSYSPNEIIMINSIESKIRNFSIKVSEINNSNIGISQYWKELIEVLYIKSCNEHNVHYADYEIMNNHYLKLKNIYL